MQPLEDSTRHCFIPAVTGKSAITDQERNIFSLPVRLGGLNTPNPTITSAREHNASKKITAPLVNKICQQTLHLDYQTETEQLNAKSQAQKDKREAQSRDAENLFASISPTLMRLIDMAQKKGSSNLPIESHGFVLHKGAFCDAIHFWLAANTTTKQLCLWKVIYC